MAERKKLGELLLEAKIINQAQLQSAIAHQRQWGSRLGTALMEKGFVDEETLAKFLGQQRGVPSVVLGKMKIAPDVLKRIPRELQEKHVLVPIAVEKVGNRETLVVAMAEPSNLQALDEIKFAIGGTRIKTVIAVEATIKKAISGDSRQFRPSLAPKADDATKPEITDEFAIVRGTMETVITKGSQAVVPGMPPTAKSPASATRTPARGVDAAPIGEAVLELEADPEISEMEPVQLEMSDFEPIVTNVGPPPRAPAPPAPVAPPGPDAFLDALRGPPRQPGANGAATQPAPRPPPPVAPAAARPSPAPPVAERAPVPGVSPFLAPDEDRTERDIPTAPPAALATAPAPVPFALGDAFPVESMEPAPVAPAPAPFPSVAGGDPWPEPSAETSFQPLADAAPWPPIEEGSAPPPEYAENGGGPMADGGLNDLGPGAVPELALGVSPLENSVPEISLPGPEMPEGATWDQAGRVGAFDPDTAPETDLGAAAGSSGLFSIPSELEVQETSLPAGNALDEMPPESAPLDASAELANDLASELANPAFEPTAADEPAAEWVEPGFETAVSVPPPEQPAPEVEALAPEMPLETVANTFEMGVETMAPTEGDLAPPQSDPTMPEYEPTSPEPPPPEAAPEPPAMTSSTAGMVPSMTAQGSQDHVEATAIGSGHHEPTWDAPMEFTAPPEGSILADGEGPSAAPVADQLRPRDFEDDRSSVTRESPFPLGTEAARGADRLSPMHLDDPAPAPASEPEPETEHEPTVFSAPQPAEAAEELAPPREVTPPTRQSDVVPPMVRVPGEAVAPSSTMPAREPTPPSSPIAAIDISATGAMAIPQTSDEQAALNLLVSKKLKLLNAITEILLEKGLITEDEIREKISKKK